MTNAQIEREFNEIKSLDERVLDIFREDGLVEILTISTARVVWKRCFYIENNELHLIKCNCFV